MRLDALFVKLNLGSRKEAKDAISKGFLTVDGNVIKKSDFKVDEDNAIISYKGREYKYREFYYFAFNKPEGCISATADNKDITVMDVFKERYLENNSDLSGLPFNDLFPVGRLDKDTHGLLIITNDGDLAHRSLSPKYHVNKTYYLKIAKMLSENDIFTLENGTDIGEGIITEKAEIKYTIDSPLECYLTIHEGKFHQVKRMLTSVGNEVTFLKRISFGDIALGDLLEGDYRELTNEEIKSLK